MSSLMTTRVEWGHLSKLILTLYGFIQDAAGVSCSRQELEEPFHALSSLFSLFLVQVI